MKSLCAVFTYVQVAPALILCALAVTGCPLQGFDDEKPVPDVAGNTMEQARATLEDKLFTNITIVYEWSNTVPEGLVIRRAPDTYDSSEYRQDQVPIALFVSMGPKDNNTNALRLPDGTPMLFKYCPGGSFTMGADPGEQDASYLESPRREVTISQGYWLSKYEVTKQQWLAIMNTTPWTGWTDSDNPMGPAEALQWNDARDFINQLNATTGSSFCLPTEAQWEKAYRAGTTNRYYWGDDLNDTLIHDYAWFKGNTSSVGVPYIQPVGQKLPNAYGLHDMSGSVSEWVNDWFDSYDPDDLVDPAGPETGFSKVKRGGNSASDPPFCRAASRLFDGPDYAVPLAGLRVCHPGTGFPESDFETNS